METWILLFRGINVGGKRTLPMNTLIDVLQSLGLNDVKTYIQSGNAVFRASHVVPHELTAQIAHQIDRRFGFRPHIQALHSAELANAIASNPFPEAEGEPKTLHVFFLEQNPKDPNLDALEQLRSPTERFHLDDRLFFIHAPDGIGRSKLAAQVERQLGVPMTARNWRTVQKLHAMAQTP